jgi:anti-anti-sigma regulatory factor
MLIITRSEGSDLTRTLKLEGKLLGPWMGELESACCRTSQVSLDRVRLDLSSLTFVDAEGARYLASLVRDGARVIACSEFVAEMLHLEGP